MPLKKSVAVERRVDLASLFCMISRHGPAVLIALAFMGCLGWMLVVFKRWREKRRARRRGDEADSRDSNAGLEEPTRRRSTDAHYEGSLNDVKEHTYQSQVRQRNPSKHKASNRDTAIDKAQHSFFWEWNSHRTQSYAEEPVQNIENNTHESAEDVVQESELMKDLRCEEEETMPDSSEDVTTTNKNMSEKEFRQEETVQFTFNSLLCSYPTPHVTVNDRKENTSLTSVNHLESESLVPENLSPAPQKEDEDYIFDQASKTNVQTSSITNTEESVVVKEEYLPVASQKIDTEPVKLEQIEDEFKISTNVNFKPSDSTNITDLSIDGEQSESTVSPLDKQIDPTEHCPQKQMNHSAEAQTDKDLSTSQKDLLRVNKKEFPDTVPGENINISITDSITHGFDEGNDESAVHEETSKTAETETMVQNESLEDQQCQGFAPQVVEGSQVFTDNVSDQKDMITPDSKENGSNVVDSIQQQVQSASADSKIESLAHGAPSPNDLALELNEETSNSSLSVDEKVKTSTTDTTEPFTGHKEHMLTPKLDAETTIAPQLDIERNQAAIRESTDATEASITRINDKIECIVEQIVADAYEEVKQISQEAKSALLEEKTLEHASQIQQTQHSVSVENQTMASNARKKDMGKAFLQEESKEVVFCSNMAAQITEEVVNTVCSLRNLKDQVNVDSNDMLMAKADLHDQKINKAEEHRLDHDTLKNLENEMSIPPVEIDLTQTATIEVKTEQICVQPVSDVLAKDQIVKAVVQESDCCDVCPNIEPEMQAEKANAISCPEANNLAKMEDQILIKTEMVENLETSMEKSQQTAPEVLSDADNGLSKTSSEIGKLLEEDQPEIKTEILENTATANDALTKEQIMSLAASNDLSTSMEKSGCKVVIVCRTLESSVSAVEISDSEDFDGETSYLELKTSGISTCQELSVAEEMSAQETSTKNSDLTSVSALDFAQDKLMEQIKLKDNCASSPSLESGISSLAISPETEEACEEMGQTVICDLPMDFDPMLASQRISDEYQAEEAISHSLLTSDGAVIEPIASSPVKQLEDISNESLVTNEDSFGSEIEDGYQKAMEEVMMEVVDIITVTKETIVDEKKVQACVSSKAEGEKVDTEKTDISIMEATMDHNEWIIDGSYQVLPWMNAASSKDATSSKERMDLVENRPSSQTSLTEDGTENSKKVLAVQPMPQNVNVTFRVHYLPLSPDQTVAVTGDQQELGAWKTVVPLEKTKDGYWSCVVGLPAESHVEWKFVVLEKGEVCRWEECGNRLLYTGFGDDLLVHKWWGFL